MKAIEYLQINTLKPKASLTPVDFLHLPEWQKSTRDYPLHHSMYTGESFSTVAGTAAQLCPGQSTVAGVHSGLADYGIKIGSELLIAKIYQAGSDCSQQN